jgi:hypothetical protein
MTNRTGKSVKRRDARRADYDEMRDKDGFKRPGSLNPHKSKSLGRQKKRAR